MELRLATIPAKCAWPGPTATAYACALNAYEPPWSGPDTVQLLELLAVTYRKSSPPAGDGLPRR